MRSKRFFDIVFAASALLLLFPCLVLVAILIKLTSKGPIFYRSKRISQDRRIKERRNKAVPITFDSRNGERRILNLNGRPFYLLKFRTMINGADRLGGAITYERDPRITKFGAILRKTKLDEIPSLMNVLKGDMSIVGPRPESPEWVARYNENEKSVLRVKPGITGPSQIKYRNEEALLGKINLEERYLEIMRDKLGIDMEYIQKWSFGRDCKIILKTLFALFQFTNHKHGSILR